MAVQWVLNDSLSKHGGREILQTVVSQVVEWGGKYEPIFEIALTFSEV